MQARFGDSESSGARGELGLLLENLRTIDLSGDLYDESVYLDAHGGYCDIFTAKSRKHGNLKVAVKRIRVHILHNKDVSEIILRELRIWSTLDHPNVLPLLGYVMHGSYPALISRWMVNGSLMKYMEKYPDNSIVQMAKGIANGLSYLHSKDIIHSDLKSDNILISDVGEPLLADFGISRCIATATTANTTTGVKGSARWMAIELLTPGSEDTIEIGIHTTQTDIWAYGMVIYELLTRKVPFSNLKNDLLVSIAIAGGKTPPKPTVLEGSSEVLWSICEACWSPSPFERPSMTWILDTLPFDKSSTAIEGTDNVASLAAASFSKPVPSVIFNYSRPFPTAQSDESKGGRPRNKIYHDDLTSNGALFHDLAPGTKSWYKEGYLTKRGKNFGEWKFHYFVFQGPALEYYENKDGAHLGSIPIVGAQIGRQQRTGDESDSDDVDDFLHAFLIVERERGPGGQVVQHVLCCESDAERDAWVDVLSRYVMDTYNDEERITNVPTINPQDGDAQKNTLGWRPFSNEEETPRFTKKLFVSTPLDSTRQVKKPAPMQATSILDGQTIGGRVSYELNQPSADRKRNYKSHTFWSFGRSNDKQSVAPVLQPGTVFGVSLEESLAVSQETNLLANIYQCIRFLEATHAELELGIYRLSGRSAVINSLKDKFNKEGNVDILAANEDWDPHDIAGLLKIFLRELPSSIFTHELHSRFLGIINVLDLQDQIKELQDLISQLPFPNYCLLRALTAHLNLIVQNSNINKMTIRNIGIVFGPTLGIPSGVFILMMSEYDRVFKVDGEGPDSSEDVDVTPSKQSHAGEQGLPSSSDPQLSYLAPRLSVP